MSTVQPAPYFRTSIVPADLRVQMRNGDVLYLSNVERIWASKVNKRITVRNVNGEVLRFQVGDFQSWVMLRTSNSTIKVLHEAHRAMDLAEFPC